MLKVHRQVYYEDYQTPVHVVKGADASSFELVGIAGESCSSYRGDNSQNDAKDKFSLYEKGKKVRAVSAEKISGP